MILNNNFYICPGYNKNTKIFNFDRELFLFNSLSLFVDNELSELLFRILKISVFQEFFFKNLIDSMLIKKSKIIVVRNLNEDWNVVLAVISYCLYNMKLINIEVNNEGIINLINCERLINNTLQTNTLEIDEEISLIKIREIINKYFSNILSSHNGDVNVVKISKKEKLVYLRLGGSCRRCDISKINLMAYLEKLIYSILIDYKVIYI